MTLLMIHEVADPQMIKRISLRADAQPFQKCSKAERKPERAVSIQGSSSKKTIFFSSVAFFNRVESRLKASNQDWGMGHSS